MCFNAARDPWQAWADRTRPRRRGRRGRDGCGAPRPRERHPGAPGTALRRGGGRGRHGAPLRRRVQVLRRRRGRGSSTATTMGCQELYLAGGEGARRPVPEREPGRRGAGGHRGRRAPSDRLDGGRGAYPLDIDGDRGHDLVVLRFGENVLFRGRGDCGFKRANEAWGYDGGSSWTGGLQRDLGVSRCPAHVRTRPVPGARDRSRRERTSAASTSSSGPPTVVGGSRRRRCCRRAWCTLSMLFSDWDRSGRRDLRVSNDRHYSGQQPRSSCGASAPDEPPRLWTRDEGWQAVRIWGMGIASYDLNGDGCPRRSSSRARPTTGFRPLPTALSGPPTRDIAVERNANARQAVHR